MQPSSINLVRSSHSWTDADSAAGFVLRYVSPMRRQLVSVLGSNSEADEALKKLLAHLVSAGFSKYNKGRLRDFLIKGIRSSAKARIADLPENERPNVSLDAIVGDSPEWLAFWRDCLLERSWRALERYEHANPDMPLYSILFAMNAQPKATTSQLVDAVSRLADRDVDEPTIDRGVANARTMFAQLIADEVVETLQSPTKEDVKAEIRSLGLVNAFSGLSV